MDFTSDFSYSLKIHPKTSEIVPKIEKSEKNLIFAIFWHMHQIKQKTEGGFYCFIVNTGYCVQTLSRTKVFSNSFTISAIV